MKRLLLLAAFVAAPALAQTAQVSSSTKTFDNNTVAPLQADTSGNLKVTATGANDTVAQGSTTSGQSGTLVQCAVTTGAPTYTTAQTDPMSCTTTGGLRTRAEDGSNIGLGSLADAAWTTGNGSAIAILKAIDRDTLLPLAAGSNVIGAITQSGTWNVGTVTTLTGITNALPAGTNLLGKVGIDQTTVGTTNAISLAQIGANTVLTGNGIAGTGAQRVTIASDNTAFNVIAAGTAAVGATFSGNPVLIGGTTSADSGVIHAARITADGRLFSSQIASATGVDGVANVVGLALNTTDSGTYPAAAATLYFNGSTFDRIRGDVNHLSVGPALSSTYWRYTSGTTAILSNTTTAVTIKASAGGSLKNAIDSCQIGSTALGASVPIALRDGAGGTVMWAMRPPVAGWLTPVQINFVPPLVGTAATLVEVVTTTADTSGTFDVNCQGHTET